ncbi:MAG: hypothetical protein VW491_11370, partial [Gammaproteobacteria bacterium]
MKVLAAILVAGADGEPLAVVTYWNVCARWRYCMRHYSVIVSMDLANFVPGGPLRLSERAPSLQTLTCSLVNESVPDAALMILRECSRLRAVNLSEIILTPEASDAIAKLPNLRKLDLSGVGEGSPTVTDKWIDLLARNCGDLEEIYFDYAAVLTHVSP